MESYARIPIKFSSVELVDALELAHNLNIYAYDADVIACALKHRSTVLSIDQGLMRAANAAGIKILELH